MLETVGSIAKIVHGFVSAFVLAGVLIAYYSWRSKQALDRRTAALGYSGTKNKEHLEARRLITLRFREYFASETAAPSEQVRDIVAQEKEISRSIELTLAHWEIMAIAIFDDLIDEKTCFEMTGSLLVRTVNVLEGYIHYTRENPPRPRRFDYLLILHSEWKKRIEKMNSDGSVSRFSEYVKHKRDISRVFRQLSDDRKKW